MTDADPTAKPDRAEIRETIRSRLYGRWQAPPPDELTEDRLERRRLAGAMRDVVERLIATGAPLEAVSDAADELERIAAGFADAPREVGYEGYRETANVGSDPHASFEFSPLIGRANPLAPPIALEEGDRAVFGRVTFGSAYEGPPGCVHGGYVAATFDELLGAVQSMSGDPGMTGTLTVTYRTPTPLHTELRLEGRILEVEGRKIYTAGTIHAGETLCAEAKAIFVSIAPSVFQNLKAEREAAERARTG